jgi:hypothetical protein
MRADDEGRPRESTGKERAEEKRSSKKAKARRVKSAKFFLRKS